MTWEPTHRSIHDGSTARLIGVGAASIVLENECGDDWVALPGDWEPIADPLCRCGWERSHTCHHDLNLYNFHAFDAALMTTTNDTERSNPNMSLNTIQTAALTHLGTGSSDRQRALNSLVTRGFFTIGDTEEGTQEKALAYTGENPDGFCEGGIGRFLEALGVTPEKPATNVRHVTTFGNVVLTWPEDTDPTDININEAFRTLNVALGMVRGEGGWTVTESSIDWDYPDSE